MYVKYPSTCVVVTSRSSQVHRDHPFTAANQKRTGNNIFEPDKPGSGEKGSGSGSGDKGETKESSDGSDQAGHQTKS